MSGILITQKNSRFNYWIWNFDGRKSGYVLFNDKPNEVDLSEWGGVAPSCEITPGCPVCIK